MKFCLLLIGSTIFLLSGVANADQSEHHPRHHLAIFVGGGFEREDNGHEENGAALGLKYEIKINEKWGVGAAVERLYGSGQHRSWAAVIPVSFYATESWRLFAGPGFESHSIKDKYLMRFGIAYEISLGERWSASPEFLVDIIEGGAKTYVIGIAVGFGF